VRSGKNFDSNVDFYAMNKRGADDVRKKYGGFQMDGHHADFML
jgi:hypothetical protein